MRFRLWIIAAILLCAATSHAVGLGGALRRAASTPVTYELTTFPTAALTPWTSSYWVAASAVGGGYLATVTTAAGGYPDLTLNHAAIDTVAGTLSFDYIRSSYSNIHVRVDGTTVLTVAATGTGEGTGTASVAIAAGSHTITIVGIDNIGDGYVAVDNIRIPVPTP